MLKSNTGILKSEDFEKKTDFPTYVQTDGEKIKNDFINQRFQSMQAARTPVDKNRNIWQSMIEAIREPYGDERSSSEVPLASALIELFVADALKLQTDYNFKWATSKHSTAARAIEHIWKRDWTKRNRKKEFVKNEYITAWFGCSVIYTGFESYDKKYKNVIMWEDMNLTWEEKSYKRQEIIVKNIDIRMFWIDDQAIDDIEQANDCFYRQWMSFDKFLCLEDSPIYKNIKYVQPRGYSTEYKTFLTAEEKVKQWDFVLIEHYWNIEKDAYIQRANGIIIREHPIMSTIDGMKALPFTIRILGTKTYSMYGRGFCEALMTFNSDVNNLRELLMDGIRRSNSQVLAIGNGLAFNGRDFSYDNEILTFDGNLANNFQQISGNPPNQAIFSYLDRLYQDIAIYVGIDIQNIIGDAQQTAFQTEVQREASQKRVNVWLMNRDLAFERFANLHKDNLQRFFPLKDAKGLYPQLEIADEELISESTKDKKEDGSETEYQSKRFRKKKGLHVFEVTPDLLIWSIDIDVYTNATAPTINAVDREQKMDLLTRVPMIAQSYMLAKQSGFDLDSILPMKQTLKDIAANYNLDVQDSDDKEEVDGAKAELTAQLQEMMQATQWWAAPAPEWQPMAQPMEWAEQALQQTMPTDQRSGNAI